MNKPVEENIILLPNVKAEVKNWGMKMNTTSISNSQVSGARILVALAV